MTPLPLRQLRHLLVTLPATRMGGTERHTAWLAGAIAARTGMAVTLAAEPALHPALAPLLGPGVALRGAAIGWERPEPPAARAARQAAALRGLLAAVPADSAFVPLPWPDQGGGLLPVLAEAALPRLVLFHLAGEVPPPAAPPELGLDRAILAAVSAPVARRAARMLGLPAAAIALLGNPAPRPRATDRGVARAMIRGALGLPADAPLLLFVGRLEEAKGAEWLPGIAARLQAPVVVIGDGPLRPLLETHAAMQRRGWLRVLGPVADPAPWYLAADALLMPSRMEGVPLVFLEAAAHRCPVVATVAALEGLGALAPRLAWLAPSADEAGMAAGVVALRAAPGEAAAMIEAAAAHAARQRPEAAVEAALGLLRAAVPRAATAAGRAA